MGHEHLSPARTALGRRLLDSLDEAGLDVRAIYWRRLRPTRRCWALVVSLAEFGTGFEPGLSRLLAILEEQDHDRSGLRPLDLWAVSPHDPELEQYARIVAGRGADPWPIRFEGNACLEPALLYRIRSP